MSFLKEVHKHKTMKNNICVIVDSPQRYVLICVTYKFLIKEQNKTKLNKINKLIV